MKCTIEQITSIIKDNPNKGLIEIGRDQANTLMLNIQGTGISKAISQDTYFENNQVFEERSRDAISNKDLFGRLFQREEMVFTAQGGASVFNGLSDAQSKQMTEILSDVRYGLNLRSWVKAFALQAFRCDPMGVIMMEHDDSKNVYPTYKGIHCIYDYQPNGRKLEYICFKLTAGEARSFGVVDDTLKDLKDEDDSCFYRFVDDAFDTIYKYENSVLSYAIGAKSYKNPWKKVPAFLSSDLINWDNPNKFLSPIYLTIELAKTFMKDRSIRDLQKKYNGFLKAIEPLLKCSTCLGTGMVSAAACPTCTPVGADRGTGFKLTTKVADVARFPIENIAEGFDFKKIFGYVSPPIDIWNKQDTALNDLENMINDVYWGTDNRAKTSGVDAGDKGIQETATKTLANIQPIYARLNLTADWAQKTENLIADFIGKFKFPTFKKSSITYGRYYILETPDELMEEYLNMKTKKASQFSLFTTLRKYYHSLYQNNPIQLAINVKLINVEPFVHSSIQEVQAMNVSKLDYMMKLYFSEWVATKTDDFLFMTLEQGLKDDLKAYATTKMEEVKTDPLQEPVEKQEPKKAA